MNLEIIKIRNKKTPRNISLFRGGISFFYIPAVPPALKNHGNHNFSTLDI